MEHTYYTADVFTDRAFQGAQIAVFPEASTMPESLMAEIAAELNLSETVFVTDSIIGKEEADRFQLRIFTPQGEIRFAGHPMLAAASALSACGQIKATGTGKKRIIFEQLLGPIEVDLRWSTNAPLFVQFSLAANPIIDRYTPSEVELARVLGLTERDIDSHTYHPRLVSIDRPYLIVPLGSQAAVRAAAFNVEAWSQSSVPALAAQDIFIFSSKTEQVETNFHGRLMGPEIGAKEDPPIGSVMPCFAGYLGDNIELREGTYTFTIDRGTSATRRSVLHVELEHHQGKPSTVSVGGEVVLVSHGTLTL
ncbi:MAG TPA: PhzF family phenazine biosynthesis protein [Porticoccaceae bacterium]|nr:PhzF family phenazine biosynthesis protein [Porticoccaceae bacterium]